MEFDFIMRIDEIQPFFANLVIVLFQVTPELPDRYAAFLDGEQFIDR